MPNSRLSNHTIVDSTNAEEVEAALAGVWGIRSMRVLSDTPQFKARTQFRRMKDAGIGYLDIAGGCVAEFEESSVVRQKVCFSGTCKASVGNSVYELIPGLIGVLPHGEESHCHYSNGYSEVVLRLDYAALVKKLSLLMGGLPSTLQFDSTYQWSPACERFRRIIRFIVGEINQPDLPDVYIDELEQLLLSVFLHTAPHNFSDRLEREGERPAAPWRVRRLEDYLQAHWDKPLTIEAVALATGVSVRSIYAAFKASRGYGPNAYLKKIRLEHAREMLCKPGQNLTVTAIAFACGFSNLGHFAADYLEAFGERPSDTLRRSRV